MFENYRELTAEQQQEIKAIHRGIRSDTSEGERYRILAWGFVRGFPYRRIERTTRTQTLADGRRVWHNAPIPIRLYTLLVQHLPSLASELRETRYPSLREDSVIAAWLANPDGAICAPAREKSPYVKEAAAAE